MFAPTAVRLAAMRTSKRELRKMQTAVSRGPDRSSLFWWMVDHHADLLAKGSRGRMPWKLLCQDFIAKGLFDGSGKSPTELRASRTWREACEEVRRQAPTQSTPVLRRSRPAGNWSPPVAETAEPPRRAASPPVEPRASATPTALTGPLSGSRPAADRDPTVEEQLAEVRRQFAANDRKRFGSM